MARMEKESFDSLQVKPSSYVMRRVNGTFKEIGNGLFAGINYRAGQRIAYFRGTVVTREEYETKENQRYGLELGDYFVLDCAVQAERGHCKASMFWDSSST